MSGITHARSIAQAAKELGIAERTFHRWLTEDWFPGAAKTRKGWNLAKIRQTRERLGLKGSQVAAEDRELRTDERRARIAKSRADERIKLLRLREAEGELMDRRAVEAQMTTVFRVIVDFCKQAPPLAESCGCPECRPRLLEHLQAELDRHRLHIRAELMRVASELQAEFDPDAVEAGAA